MALLKSIFCKAILTLLQHFWQKVKFSFKNFNTFTELIYTVCSFCWLLRSTIDWSKTSYEIQKKQKFISLYQMMLNLYLKTGTSSNIVYISGQILIILIIVKVLYAVLYVVLKCLWSNDKKNILACIWTDINFKRYTQSTVSWIYE